MKHVLNCTEDVRLFILWVTAAINYCTTHMIYDIVFYPQSKFRFYYVIH